MRLLILTGLLLTSPLIQALTFRLDGDEVVGNSLEIEARYEDTFVHLGRVYGLGYRELMDANPGVSPWVPGDATPIHLPLAFILPDQGMTGEENIVLNLAEFRLYHFIPEKQIVRAYAVGIGKEGWQTPTSAARVTGVIENPSWTPPASVRQEQAARGITLPSVIPPGPDNPLGDYAVALSIPGYLFHGSNKTLGIGMRVSHGCIRLYDGDIEELAYSVRPGLHVSIINDPVKAGWKNDQLYLEVHPQLEEDRDRVIDVQQIVAAALARRPDLNVAIDWDRVQEIEKEKSGTPGIISLSDQPS
ncbi:MAG: L,D-transpeptidase family protein [Gammaproteobacteria bacterium]|nr:L,D-transpeptidase family protein [Pseudomonadales bacterium]MCP5347859.1 L,D-transpeptidase family protein [Pseudomonadales bacterium]